MGDATPPSVQLFWFSIAIALPLWENRPFCTPPPKKYSSLFSFNSKLTCLDSKAIGFKLSTTTLFVLRFKILNCDVCLSMENMMSLVVIIALLPSSFTSKLSTAFRGCSTRIFASGFASGSRIIPPCISWNILKI
ncbi:hypothetical protein D3C73_618170 [compost metagenome]